MASQALPFCFGNSSFPAYPRAGVAASGQELRKKWVQHALLRILLPDPLRELAPTRAVGSFDMPPLHERALVQQWDAVPPIGKLIEFFEESIPGGLVRV